MIDMSKYQYRTQKELLPKLQYNINEESHVGDPVTLISKEELEHNNNYFK